MSMRAAKTRTEIRQEQIAQAALTLIARHGYHRLSVAALAQKVGVATSAIYRHYQSKDEILDAVLDLISKRLLENVQAARQEAVNSLERLELLLMRHVKLIENDVPIPRVVFSEEIFTGNKLRRHRARQVFQLYLEAIANLMREGQGAREIRKNFDPDTLSMMFLGLIQPAAILWLMGDGDYDLGGQVQGAWNIFRKSIQVDTATPAPGHAISSHSQAK